MTEHSISFCREHIDLKFECLAMVFTHRRSHKIGVHQHILQTHNSQQQKCLKDGLSLMSRLELEEI